MGALHSLMARGSPGFTATLRTEMALTTYIDTDWGPLETGIPLGPLGPSGGGHLPAQPLGNATANKQRREHGGLYSRILEDRQADGRELTPEDEFYRSYDIEKVAVNGFPSIAAFHTMYPNTRTCRAFKFPNYMLITRYESQIQCLIDALVDLESKGARKDGSQPVPFDKEKFISRCLRSPDQISLVKVPVRDEEREEDEEQKNERIEAMKENLYANLERILDKYFKQVNRQCELERFPQASTRTHRKLFKHIKSNISGLDAEALDYLRAEDDFIYAEGDPLYERVHNFVIYFRAAFVKTVRFISCNRLLIDGHIPFGSGYYSVQRIALAIKSLTLIFNTILFLLPVGILYLGKPGKAMAFLVVAVFCVFFGLTLIAFGNGTDRVLLGSAAYGAVLVVFLSVNN
ncbi:hypothetical protein EKO27_g10825 [Xylaria grammica]|uniref:DUF6594 domain-containing protein n=1 Tax=Xylaria grammica TaxID=363999 RepID=A0A439CQ55_9PEZI|nr:hypothetical protein EKO27_g10825 [Xylaria grammica]